MAKKKKKNVRKQIMQILDGSVLAKDIVLKNKHFIFVLFVLIVLSIANRYSADNELAQINTLQTELKSVRNEAQTISAQVTSLSRGTKVKELVTKHNLGLEDPQGAIYKIEK